MRVLHITAQKPNSTGSGVYMSGLIDSMDKLGHEQAVIAGIDVRDNRNSFKDNIKYYPMIYNTDKLPFPVIGISDNMPYESTKYKELTPYMVEQIKYEFLRILNKALDEFKPELIICNHLYLTTSFVKEVVKDTKVVGICHGTCLRQLENIELKREYIISQISKLDCILVLHESQKKEVMRLFNVKKENIHIIGSGYDDKIFYNKHYKRDEVINITYAGKLCESKGIKSLLSSIDKLNYDKNDIVINFAGSGSDKKDVYEIKKMADKCKYKVIFHGKLNHKDLSQLFNKSDIFILPSFYEGLPIVVIEALACGLKVVVSEFDGLKSFMGENINDSGNISYIKLPRMESLGVPMKRDLLAFEDDIAKSIERYIESIKNNPIRESVDLKNKTWDGLGIKVDKIIKNIVLKNEKLNMKVYI